MYSRIIGTGSYLPQKVLTNKDLESLVDTTDEWVTISGTFIPQNIAGDEYGRYLSFRINQFLKK